MDIKLAIPKSEDYYEVDKLLLHLHNKHAIDYPTYYNTPSLSATSLP